jgi:hypothetical protein
VKPGRSICCKACTRRSNTLLKFAEISSRPKRKSSGLKAAYKLLGGRSPGLSELLQSRARARLGCLTTIVPETHSESSASLSTPLNLSPQTLKPETLAKIRSSGKLADRSWSNSTYMASLEFWGRFHEARVAWICWFSFESNSVYRLQSGGSGFKLTVWSAKCVKHFY